MPSSGGAEGWEDLEEYGKAQAAWCAALLDVPHGIPGPDPLRRVFSRWAPEELPRGFLAWTQALSEASGGAMVSIDGTTLRHACAQATATAAIPMVRAWASANRLVLGQLKVGSRLRAGQLVQHDDRWFAHGARQLQRRRYRW